MNHNHHSQYLLVILLSCMLWSLPESGSTTDISPDDQQYNKQRAQDLYHELRCVACNSQSIADSNAEIAAAMRQLVQEKIAAGWSDEQIKSFLRERYGDGIFFTPPLGLRTYVLWFGPLLILLAGSLLIKKFLLSRPPRNPS